MNNNALFGFMVQKSICDIYKLKISSERLLNVFDSNNDVRIKEYVDDLVKNAFKSFELKPVECTTFNVDSNGAIVPYNFILSDNSTLSIRTNFNGAKVAPRVVGQAGFEKLNIYFSDIYGKPIVDQDDIKHLICENPEKVLPIFIRFLLDADYILWIFQKNNKFSYHLIDGNSDIDIEFLKDKFSFTKNYNEWNESTTLKYDNKSIAEIQVHKNRSFKFRFNMNNLLLYLTSKRNNNETIGITAEKTICDIFNIDYPTNFFKRYSVEAQYQMEDCIRNAFMYLPKPIKHCGNDSGNRGGNSKSSYDFILEGNKTLSLKTNIGKMVCPPEVGQPNDKTCYLYFGHLIKEDHIDKNIFKKMVYEHISEMLQIYIEHMFDSDYLLRIFTDNETFKINGVLFNFEIYSKNLGSEFEWDIKRITFSKPTIEQWNESNTIYYDGIAIGEFQVHFNRNCFKFRFNFKNLMKILRKK